MTPHQYSVMAAVLGHTNIGLPLEGIQDVAKRLLRPECNLDFGIGDAVSHLSASNIENEEMLKIFVEEAEGFEKLLKDLGVVKIYKAWPWMSDLVKARDICPDYDQQLELAEEKSCRS